jgi:hypothetical protein
MNMHAKQSSSALEKFQMLSSKELENWASARIAVAQRQL